MIVVLVIVHAILQGRMKTGAGRPITGLQAAVSHVHVNTIACMPALYFFSEVDACSLSVGLNTGIGTRKILVTLSS